MFGWVKKIFKKSSEKVQDIVKTPELSPSEKALIQWNVEYRKLKDGTLVVPDNLNISNKGLKELPDFSAVIVQGNFACLHNPLTSLKGAPRMFKSLVSDFGVFWEGNVPENLRNPPPPRKAATPGSFDL